MTGKSVLLGLLLALGVDALRTQYSISELRKATANSAALEAQYHDVSTSAQQPGAATADDVDPSLLYPAYNLSVPVDHFHNDSLYEPHVSKAPLLPVM